MDRELIWLPGIILQLLMGGVARAYEPICEHKGVHFGYVLKEHTPGSRRDEIVLRAVNSNDYVVQVEYRLACRSASGGESLSNSVSLHIRGRGEMAGELSGLWYLPFEAGESVSELQLVDVVVNRADRPWGNWLRHSEFPQIEYRLRCGDYHSPRSGYAWFVQFRTAANHPVHFNYGVQRASDPRGTFGRVSLKPGAVHETPSHLLRLRPNDGSKVAVTVAKVRVGWRDEGDYLAKP